MSHLSSSGNLYQFPKPRHQERMKLGTPSERTLFLLKLLAWLVTSYKKKGRVWVGHSKRFSCSLHEIKIYQDCRKILENLCLHSAPFLWVPVWEAYASLRCLCSILKFCSLEAKLLGVVQEAGLPPCAGSFIWMSFSSLVSGVCAVGYTWNSRAGVLSPPQRQGTVGLGCSQWTGS